MGKQNGEEQEGKKGKREKGKRRGESKQNKTKQNGQPNADSVINERRRCTSDVLSGVLYVVSVV